MNYVKHPTPHDLNFARSKLTDFVPLEVFDIHAHPYRASDFPAGTISFLSDVNELGCREHRAVLQRYMPVQSLHGMYFGMPHKTANRMAMNKWLAEEVKTRGTPLSRGLMVVSPSDDQADVAAALRRKEFSGIKVYHCYANRPDTMQAKVEEYAPDWMWELLHETQGILLLHIVRDGAMEDLENQRSIRRLCKTYPRARLMLAHIARSFCYRNARNGLHALEDLDNVTVDTSAIGEASAFRAALRILGPRRVLWGSDFPVSEMRGRCVTTGNMFFWLHPEVLKPDYQPLTASDMTLIGIESLVALREACEDAGLTAGDVHDLFMGNALRVLTPHLAPAVPPAAATHTVPVTGPARWKRASTVISGGTGLLSKRAQRLDPERWPAFYSRSSGCMTWDLDDRRYIDFLGGFGAILLGYADPDVNAALFRRLSLGSYSSLVNPQEVELAEKLLSLHPWAGKVRFARGGGDGMAVAIRVARAATRRTGIAFCGYHGWHDWYLAANLAEKNALDGHLLSGLEPKGVPRELRGTAIPFRYNDLASLDQALAQLGTNLAAVVMEPFRSQMPADNFVAKVAARCHAAGGVFVADEVTSGLRYGYPGAMAQLGIEPDIAVYAKAVGNGVPFGAVIGRNDVMDAANASFISSSSWTDGLGTAAALTVLQKVEGLGVLDRVNEKGRRLQAGLRSLAATHADCQLKVSGQPASPAMTFALGAQSSLAQTLYTRRMRERGLLVSSMYYVMLAHDDAVIDQLLETADSVLKDISSVITSGALAKEVGTAGQLQDFSRLA